MLTNNLILDIYRAFYCNFYMKNTIKMHVQMAFLMMNTRWLKLVEDTKN